MVKIKKEDLQKLTILKGDANHHNNNGTIYLDGNIIYKLVDAKYFFPDETRRNIDYQINNPLPHTPIIYDELFIDEEFSGYIMEYIKDSMSFRQALTANLPEEVKRKAILDIFETLKELHKNNITLGDVHLDNFLITKDGGYVIDLDYMRFPGDEFKFQTCYDITKGNTKYTRSSKYSDSIKVLIVALSLLLGIDLEARLLKNNEINLEELYQIVLETNNKELIEYFNKIMNGEDIYYFDDFLNSIIPKQKQV
jgi:serine/threonine protein kinase